MADRLYVLALFSEAHNCWFEFVGTDKSDKVEVVQRLCRDLVALCPVHARIVSVERDDPALIRAALGKLGRPDLSFSPKEFAMYCERHRLFEAELHASLGEPEAEPLAAMRVAGAA